jgi:hypothetical protein
MQEKHKRKVQSIINKLKEMTEELEQILDHEDQTVPSSKKTPKMDRESLIKAFSDLNRQDAEEFLKNLKQAELGEIFSHQGGSSSDKKKPKQWLIEQIIWRAFDFKKGHEAIRGAGQ